MNMTEKSAMDSMMVFKGKQDTHNNVDEFQNMLSERSHAPKNMSIQKFKNRLKLVYGDRNQNINCLEEKERTNWKEV